MLGTPSSSSIMPAEAARYSFSCWNRYVLGRRRPRRRCSNNTTFTRTTSTSAPTATTNRSSMSVDAWAAWTIPLACVGLLVEAYGRTELEDAAPSGDCQFGPTIRLIQAHHVQTLQDRGIVIIPNAISASRLESTRVELLRSSSSSKSNSSSDDDTDTTATTTQLLQHSSNDNDVRQDLIAWVRSTRGKKEESSLTTTTRKSAAATTTTIPDDAAAAGVVGKDLDYCIQLLRGVMYSVDHQHASIYRATEDHTVPQQCQLAFYAGDEQSSYQRHLDQCSASLEELGLLEWMRLSDYRGRAVTAILYLNTADRTEWQGGALRCWVAKDGPTADANSNNNNSTTNNVGTGDDSDVDQDFHSPFDVVPKGGTLVIFQSAKVEHMVLPSSVDRYALTSWISGTPTTARSPPNQ